MIVSMTDHLSSDSKLLALWVEPGSSAPIYQQTVTPLESHGRFLSLEIYAVAAAFIPEIMQPSCVNTWL